MGRRPLAQRRYQNDDHGQVDSSTEKSHRWRGCAPPTPLAATAETESPVIVGSETSWLAGIVGPMQGPSATRATEVPRTSREILIDLEEQGVKAGISEHGLARLHRVCFKLAPAQVQLDGGIFLVALDRAIIVGRTGRAG